MILYFWKNQSKFGIRKVYNILWNAQVRYITKDILWSHVQINFIFNHNLRILHVVILQYQKGPKHLSNVLLKLLKQKSF